MKREALLAAIVFGSGALGLCTGAEAQTCTTQSKLVASVRDSLSESALSVATAIKSGDTAALSKLASADLAGNFNATAYLARTTGEKIAGDTLRVTQLYQLDAHGVQPGASEVDFSCPYVGVSGETDFAIGGLPPGLYGFAMVEADGAHPYLLSMLLRQDAGVWKLAGLYPRARQASGHDGLWYWTDARAKVKAGQPWAAWLEYGEADDLLRPVDFVGSSHLEMLRDERATSAPGELKDGVTATTPYAIAGPAGASFSITSMALTPNSDGRLDLVVHYRAAALNDATAERARNQALAKALLSAHPEIRSLVGGVTVFAETDGQPPFATTMALTELS